MLSDGKRIGAAAGVDGRGPRTQSHETSLDVSHEVSLVQLAARLGRIEGPIRITVDDMLTALVLPRRDRNSTQRQRPRTYTVEQAAEILGISRSHAYACVKSGEITSVRLRRRIVIPAHALDALLGHAAPPAGSEFRDG